MGREGDRSESTSGSQRGTDEGPRAYASTLSSDSGPDSSGFRQAVIPIGSMLGGTYRVEELIGQGAMGAVYRVVHTGLGREFAAKVLATESGQLESAWRLVQEARTASSVDHENIVDVTDLGHTEEGRIYVVMELLRGRDLDTYLQDRDDVGPPDAGADEATIDIGAQILAGLAAAHDRGIVHRDLKPANIFLDEKEGRRTRVKIVDFGMSKLADGDSAMRLTRTGQVVGTPLYMAPEQGSGEQVDHRTDLYAFGVVAYEMITGDVPFPADTVVSCLLKHATEPPPPIGERRPDVPPAVVQVVERALAKRPSDRWQSAAELRDAWLGAWGMAPEGRPYASAASFPSNDPAPSRRVAPMAFGLLAGAAALAGVIGWWASSSPPEPEPIQGPEIVATDPLQQDATEDAPDAVPDEPPEALVEETVEPVPPVPPEPTLSVVHLRSTPSPATVESTSGERLGRTPLDVEVPPEGLTVVVTRRHFRSERVRLEGDDPSAHVRLRPTQGLAPID
ncbi:MAG: protein kinase [Sandaracinaceae bacterium]